MSRSRKKLEGLTERLNVAVLASGKPHTELCRQAHIPKTTFYSHLSGEAAMSELDIARYCTVLNISADWLLGIKREEKRNGV